MSGHNLSYHKGCQLRVGSLNEDMTISQQSFYLKLEQIQLHSSIFIFKNNVDRIDLVLFKFHKQILTVILHSLSK